MRLDPKKILTSRRFNTEEVLSAYEIMRNLMDAKDADEFYYYIDTDKNGMAHVFVTGIYEVEWLAKKLNCRPKQALMCINEYPGFWEELKDTLNSVGVSGYDKRFLVFTKRDLMNDSNNFGSHEEYVGDSKEDAMEYFKKVLGVADVISIIEDEEEED